MDKSLKPASNKASINETSRRCCQILDDKFKTAVVLEALREDWSLIDKFFYLDALQKIPVDSAPIKNWYNLPLRIKSQIEE
jgi:hypothetical protein